MRLALIAHLKFPLAAPYAGGLESFTATLIERLRHRGHDVTVFGTGDSDPALGITPIVPRATIPAAAHMPPATRHRWVELVENYAYEGLLTKLKREKFDIIHNNSIHPFPLRFARQLASPLVTTLHVPPLPRLVAEVATTGIESCGRFINISAANARGWADVLPGHPVIHNGICTRTWSPGQPGCPGHSLDRSIRRDRAIWFGRVVPDKGTHHAIAAAHAAGMPIDVIGPVENDDYFREQVQPLLRPGDRFHGHQNHTALVDFLRRAAVCLVTPVWDEPFGLVVAESLACGCPVAGFDRGAIGEILTPATGRVVPGGDIAGLAAAIDQCLELDRADCVTLAQSRYSLDRMVANYEAAFDRILNPNSAVPLPRSRSLINLMETSGPADDSSLASF